MTRYRSPFISLIAVAAVSAVACAPQQRMGMVVDPATGLQHGSVIQRNIVVDSSQFTNRKIKLRIRNTSGDPAFDLYGFRSSLESAYAAKGYEPTNDDSFGVLIDINVVYSGQVSRNMASQFGFLGTVGGGVAGAAIGGNAIGAAAGVVAGATLGTIIGSYITEDTYIVVAEMNFAVVDVARGTREKSIVFSSGRREKQKRRKGIKPFAQRVQTGIAVFAGGRNVPQSRISYDVRQRFLRILSDVI